MLATVDAYSISLFLHISAVVIGFGATYAEAIMFPIALKLDKRHLPYVHRLGLAINQRLATPAMVVILITGIYQVAEDDGRNWEFGDAWVSATFLILIILGGLTGGYFVPTDRKLAEMADRDLASGSAEMSDEYQATAKKIGAVGALAGVLILVAIFLMTTKPGA
jgi:Predicted integral membrane protein (DUF2269)